MKKKGIWIDSNLTGRGLSPLDKLLYSQIVYYSKDTGGCLKSNIEFSIELEVSESSIKRSLEILQEKGIMERATDRRKGNIRILTPLVQNDPTPLVQNDPTPKVKMTLPLVQNDPTPKVKMTLPLVQNDPTYIGETTIKQLKEQLLNNTINDFQKNENLVSDSEIKKPVSNENGGISKKEKKAPQAGGAGGETEFPFEVIWGMYGKKGSIKVAQKRYEKVTEINRAKIFEQVPKYVASTPEVQFRKNFEVYLNQESYNDQIIQRNANTTRSFRDESKSEYAARVASELNEIFEIKFGRNSNEPAHEATNVPDGYTSFSFV